MFRQRPNAICRRTITFRQREITICQREIMISRREIAVGHLPKLINQSFLANKHRHFTLNYRESRKKQMKKDEPLLTRLFICLIPALVLKVKFCTELHDTRSADGVHDFAEIGTSEFAVGRSEVCRIEDVENIPTDFKRNLFVDFRSFDKT